MKGVCQSRADLHSGTVGCVRHGIPRGRPELLSSSLEVDNALKNAIICCGTNGLLLLLWAAQCSDHCRD